MTLPSVPANKFDEFIHHQPAIDTVVDLLPDTDSVIAFMLTNKKIGFFVLVSISRNERISRKFAEKFVWLEQISSSLLKRLFEIENEFSRLCSPKQFVGEILTYVPLIGEVAAEHFGYHIPDPVELFNSYAGTSHFIDQHKLLDAEYDSGAKIDQLMVSKGPIMSSAPPTVISTKVSEHFQLSNKQFVQFIEDNWIGVGFGITKIFVAKFAPVLTPLFTAKKVYDIGECFLRRRNILNDFKLTRDEKEAVLNCKRYIRWFSPNKYVKSKVIDNGNHEFQTWLVNYSIIRLKKGKI